MTSLVVDVDDDMTNAAARCVAFAVHGVSDDSCVLENLSIRAEVPLLKPKALCFRLLFNL